jgi:hypothetical protein
MFFHVYDGNNIARQGEVCMALGDGYYLVSDDATDITNATFAVTSLSEMASEDWTLFETRDDMERARERYQQANHGTTEGGQPAAEARAAE